VAPRRAPSMQVKLAELVPFLVEAKRRTYAALA
jgi:hypothetical protein